jgi:hypothetical protein
MIFAGCRYSSQHSEGSCIIKTLCSNLLAHLAWFCELQESNEAFRFVFCSFAFFFALDVTLLCVSTDLYLHHCIKAYHTVRATVRNYFSIFFMNCFTVSRKCFEYGTVVHLTTPVLFDMTGQSF